MYTFNELSLYNKASSIDSARLIIKTFVNSCIKAKNLGLGDLRLCESHVPNFYNITILADYSIGKWLKDNQVNQDLRDKFKEIVTSSPLICSFEINEVNVYSRSEFNKYFENQTHVISGLGVAYIFDTLSISISTHHEWHKNSIEISHYYLNDQLEEVTNNIIVKHFSSPQNLQTHIDWWEQHKIDSINNSSELWEKRKDIFPNLVFCGEVENQLKSIGTSKLFNQIIDRLTVLNNYLENWNRGSFNYNEVNQKTNLRISPESTSTLNKFGTLRKFNIPSKGKVIFDLHIKTGDLRFHFYPDNESKKVYIGYIGKHLRIASEG